MIKVTIGECGSVDQIASPALANVGLVVGIGRRPTRVAVAHDAVPRLANARVMGRLDGKRTETCETGLRPRLAILGLAPLCSSMALIAGPMPSRSRIAMVALEMEISMANAVEKIAVVCQVATTRLDAT